MIEVIEELRDSGKVTVDEDHDWGYQLRWVNEDEYCCKFLVLTNKEKGGYHYHKEKKETFAVLQGMVSLYIEHEELGKEATGDLIGFCEKAVMATLELGDCYTVFPTDKHWIRNASPVDDFEVAIILEVSTHDDDLDTHYIKEIKNNAKSSDGNGS